MLLYIYNVAIIFKGEAEIKGNAIHDNNKLAY